ncbi:MAG: RluA family pseudouridine synthase [Ilumatobacteraceae bacterium]
MTGISDDADLVVEVIPPALAGERLDRIVSLISGASRADAASLVAAGGASVDGAPAPSGKVRLDEGQTVVVDLGKLPQPALPQPDPSVDVRVIYVDDDVIVIDKQAGLVVHPGAGHPDGTLVNGLLARFPEISDVGQQGRPGIVHRLDVGTSGLLVVARSPLAYDVLVAALAARDVGRRYRTLVWGHPANPIGVIDAPIGRDHRDPMKMAVVVDGKPARTQYRVLRGFREPADVSELECRLETGRTHQIRVHLAAIGHPVVGDGAYGGARSGVTPPRPVLHAAELSFEHPATHETMSFSSTVPDDLRAVFDSLSLEVEPE